MTTVINVIFAVLGFALIYFILSKIHKPKIEHQKKKLQYTILIWIAGVLAVAMIEWFKQQ